MRNDLSANFLTEMSKTERFPIQIAVFHFEIGDVCVSDRDISLGGVVYTGIVEDWGELATVGGVDAISSTHECAITLWNGGANPFTNYFQAEDPINVFVSIYQGFAGLDFDDFAIIGEFVIQDPIMVSEKSSLITLDLVSTNMRYFSQVGTLLTKENFPDALESDLNKPIDLIVGDAGQVQCLCSKQPPVATMTGSILSNPTKVYTHENLSDENFTSFGFIQIDDEIMQYNYRNADYFNVIVRGSTRNGTKTKAVDHSDGATIIQANLDTRVEYVIGQGPLSNASSVLVNGQEPTIPYQLSLGGNPAKIIFDRQPTFAEYSKGARVLEERFDSTVTYSQDPSRYNTAEFPYNAYDEANRAKGAIINKDHRRLSIRQDDDQFDDGEIVKLFLGVEHWATKAFLSDRVDVWVVGIGLIGTLNRPNPDDIINVGGEVDLEHGHLHEPGGVHEHSVVQPTIETTDPEHIHGGVIQGEVIVNGGNIGLPKVIDGKTNATTSQTITFGPESNISHQSLQIGMYISGVEYVELRLPGQSVRWETTATKLSFTVDQIVNVETFASDCIIRVGPSRIVGSYVSIREATMTTTKKGGIEYAPTRVTAGIDSGAVVNRRYTDTLGNPIKDPSDVVAQPRETAAEREARLQITISENSSRSVLQRFDVTSHLQTIDWDWTKNRIVYLNYVNGGDNASVIVTNMFFEVEYRQRQIRTTNDVTCSPIGVIENRPDAVVQHLLNNVAGVPLDKFSSVYRDVPKWDDNVIWDDSEIWLDEGQVSGVPSGAAFEEAGAWYSHRPDYKIDGVIPGNISVKDAIQQIAWQSRSKVLWQHGSVQMVVLRKSDSWLIAKDIPLDEIQLRSMSSTRSRVDEIVNNIDLFHTIDRLSTAAGSGKFDATASKIDIKSVSKHGDKRKDDLWLFDLVRNQNMAADIADYYIWALGETSTYYNFKTYLTNFDLEKKDYITISAYRFQQLKKLPVVISEIVRIFGSGKLSSINILNIAAQSIRHKSLVGLFDDSLSIADNLQIDSEFDSDLSDQISMSDLLTVVQGKLFQDELTLSDDFNSYSIFMSTLAESLTLTESVSFDMDVGINEQIIVEDNFNLVHELCFGACGFGTIPFGSRTQHAEDTAEYISFDDELTVNIGTILEDDVNMSDTLIISDCFGCRIGDGFGITPFGS